MKVSTLIEKLKELNSVYFHSHRVNGNVPDEPEVHIEFWDKDGFQGLTTNINLTLGLFNDGITIFPEVK